MVIRDKLMALVAEGKRIRRERRKASIYGTIVGDCDNKANDEDADYDDGDRGEVRN